MKKIILVPLYSLGYYKDCRTKLINATLGGGRNAQHITVHPSIFYAIFPRLSRKWAGDSVEATAEQVEALGLTVPTKPNCFREMPTVMEPEPTAFQARYVFDPFTGRYVVNLLEPRQELSARADHFRQITGISAKSVLGSISLTLSEAAAIGFIVNEEVIANDRIHSELLPA
ncbi:hypothetical protein QYF50_17465 [Paenibacillus vini]|uniref:hypothetical protein n=1 Tax=Paenibacillus vini TaxID=1476024 RepID=UPI0025B732D1|nr:hypothetical protein [Paenibacillus vini]MDN4069694.1 hypothetical protein [Paenibacillus vini]